MLDADPRFAFSAVSTANNAGQEFSLLIDEAEPRCIAARLGASGPILGTVRVKGFRLFSGSDANCGVVETYDDGTEVIEMGLVLSPVLPEVIVEAKLIVGGVVFEDGTVFQRWIASDFNALGEANVRFLRPAAAKTSTCHTLTAWQARVLLGSYR